MKRCKILFIHQVGYRGGAGTMLANIIAALDKRKFEPVVVCPYGDGNEQLVAAGAEVLIAPKPIYQFSHYTGYSTAAVNPFFIKNFFLILRDQSFWENYIRSSEADIVCLNAITLAPMARSARRAGAKVLCTVQETTVRGMFGLRTAWLYHILSTQMDAVVFISEFDRAKAACKAPIVEVIPNWVDLAIFDRSSPQERARRELSIPQDSRVVLMMGGIDKLKGTLQLVQAAARLSKIEQLLFIVAGYAGPLDLRSATPFQRLRFALRRLLGLEYRKRVLRAVAVNDLGERVRFIGMHTDVPQLYAAADILVFPATKPHQARPVLEAGAMAKPVVVPDFPQTKEFVSHGVNGLTYTPGEVKSLTEALLTLLVDKALARTIGIDNFLKTCERHDGASNAARFEDVFKRLA
jgi:glycosyltransferase involved in cell wall biosynthesis